MDNEDKQLEPITLTCQQDIRDFIFGDVIRMVVDWNARILSPVGSPVVGGGSDG